MGRRWGPSGVIVSQPETLRPWALGREWSPCRLTGVDSSSHQVALVRFLMAPLAFLRSPSNGSQLCDPWERLGFHLLTHHPDRLCVCPCAPAHLGASVSL